MPQAAQPGCRGGRIRTRRLPPPLRSARCVAAQHGPFADVTGAAASPRHRAATTLSPALLRCECVVLVMCLRREACRDMMWGRSCHESSCGVMRRRLCHCATSHRVREPLCSEPSCDMMGEREGAAYCAVQCCNRAALQKHVSRRRRHGCVVGEVRRTTEDRWDAPVALFTANECSRHKL
eukprot:gene16943-biopygen4651